MSAEEEHLKNQFKTDRLYEQMLKDFDTVQFLNWINDQIKYETINNQRDVQDNKQSIVDVQNKTEVEVKAITNIKPDDNKF